jgi:signal transduction histidine kinase/HAMP domain-containing protein
VGSNPTLSASSCSRVRAGPGGAAIAYSGPAPAPLTVARPRETSLLSWVWRSYVRNALVPLLLVELLLVAAYLASHAWSLNRHVAVLREVAREELSRIASDESAVIELQLGRVASLIDVLRRRAEDALAAPGDASAKQRQQRLAAVRQLTQDIADVSPSIARSYLDTSDVVLKAAARATGPGPGLPAATARPVVWTEVVLDPEQRGWIVSAVAPVYRGNSIDAVIVADVTIDQIAANVRGQEIPWNGSAALIGGNNVALVQTPAASPPFGRAELQAIQATFGGAASGTATLAGAEPHLVAWATIPATDWKLVTLAREEIVFRPSRTLSDDLVAIGWVMLGGLVGFYLIFFSFLYRRAQAVSRSISEPLAEIERMAHRIAIGDYQHALPAFEVSEFRHTAGELERMGRLLGDSNRARESAETRLTERNEELSTILSLSPDGLVSFDAAGIVTETNPAFLDMTGWSRDELIGRSHAVFWSRLAAQGSAPEPETGVQSILRLQHPRLLVLECRVVGATGGAKVAYFRDVTRADELDRTKSRFLATAAHELRTPIAVITGYTEFLEDSEPPARQRREILATMRRHGDQITGIVTELLDLARIEARAGRDFTLLRQPLAPVVRGFVETFRIGEDARVPLLTGDTGDAEVVVDADKFTQALGNVLSNACKYSPPGSPVTVQFVESDAEVGVQVRDQGEGMDEEVLRRVFERFYRGESAAGVPGSGLGMSIVKEIMDIHGGRVGIVSRPGHGTNVTLWLPRAVSRG